jgi:hypothetical protein
VKTACCVVKEAVFIVGKFYSSKEYRRSANKLRTAFQSLLCTFRNSCNAFGKINLTSFDVFELLSPLVAQYVQFSLFDYI